MSRIKRFFVSLVASGAIVAFAVCPICAEEMENRIVTDASNIFMSDYVGMESDTIIRDCSESVLESTDNLNALKNQDDYSTETASEIYMNAESVDNPAEQIPSDDSKAGLDILSPDDSSIMRTLSDESESDTVITGICVEDDSTPASETVVGAMIRRDIEDGLYLLVPKLNSARCISVAGNSKTAGANVQLVTKNCGFAQAFYVRKIPGTSRYTFVNYHTGLAVSIDDGSAVTASGSDQSIISANVIQNPLTNALNQQWVLEDMGNGYLQIRACGKAYVLDLPAAQTNPGTNVQVYKANQTDAQQWNLVKAYGKIAAEARLADAGLTKGYYRISPSDISGLSVDITSNSKNNNANVRLFTKMNTGGQIFRIVPIGDGTYTINGYNSGKYLNCANAKAGSNIYQAAYSSSNYQRWYILKDVDTGKFVIRNKNGSHVVMSAEGNEKGVNVAQDSFAGTTGQYWTLAKVAGSSIHVEPRDGIYEIRSGLNGQMCLDVSGGSSLNNANIQLYTANGTDAQRFAITGSGYGVYKVINVNSMRAMHLKGNGTASGTNVLQYKELSSTAQKWRIAWNRKSGGYQIWPYGKSTCLDVAGGVAKNGANVQAATVNNSARQMWTLNKITSYDGKYHMKVMTSGTTCVFKVYQVVGGVFTERLSTSGYVDRNGAGKTVEGDGKTPIGTFTVGRAYGIADDPGSIIPYAKVTNDMYWCGRSNSPYYNTLIDVAKSGSGDEHLIEYTESYQYLLDIGYNPT